MKGIYLVGDYPTREKFHESARAVADTGFDFLEVGIPFNDPVADGPVIASAALKAIKSGVTPRSVMESVAQLKSIPIKKYVMTYANIIDSYGKEAFSRDASPLLNGCIIADLPNRMAPLFAGNELTLPIIPFATLETRERDLDAIAASRGDFVYFIGVRGITGSDGGDNSGEVSGAIGLLKSHVKKPVVIGFGIKTPADALRAMEQGDGFVIGTEAVARQGDPRELERYLKDIMKGLA